MGKLVLIMIREWQQYFTVICKTRLKANWLIASRFFFCLFLIYVNILIHSMHFNTHFNTCKTLYTAYTTSHPLYAVTFLFFLFHHQDRKTWQERFIWLMMPQGTIPHGREGMAAFMVVGSYSKVLFIWQLLEADCDYHDQEWCSLQNPTPYPHFPQPCHPFLRLHSLQISIHWQLCIQMVDHSHFRSKA